MIALNLEFDAKAMQAELEKLPVMVQLAALESGVRPAATIVKRRVRELAPRSSVTGTTDKWSRSTKAKRTGESPLRDTVHVKILRPKNHMASALVGFQWPTGNKAYLLIPMLKATRTEVLWGKPSGKEVRKGDDFLRQAFDETRQQQIAAFEGGVVKAVNRRLKEMGFG